jgi:hypothetical protein
VVGAVVREVLVARGVEVRIVELAVFLWPRRAGSWQGMPSISGGPQALPEGLLQLLSLQVDSFVQALSVRFWGEVKIALLVSHDHLL